MKWPVVWFAPTLAAARRARRRAEGSRRENGGNDASPRSTKALARALQTGARVRVVDPVCPSPGWERAKRRVLLPAAPGLLRDAIGGIAADEPPPGRHTRGDPTRAHWIPGELTDVRASALLHSAPVPELWIVEDFRKLRLSPAARANVERHGVRIAAYRALALARGSRRKRRGAASRTDGRRGRIAP